MSLDAGGHLTHGSHVGFSIKTTKPSNTESMGKVSLTTTRFVPEEHQPKMIIAGFSAYSQVLISQKFREIADEVGAYLLVDMAHIAGLVAAGKYRSPVLRRRSNDNDTQDIARSRSGSFGSRNKL